MRHLLITVTSLLIALAALPAYASKEGVLRLSQFSISSDGIGSSGQVQVSGTQTPEGISSLKVNAFGHEFVAPPEVIKELQGLLVNGMLLSYEHGRANGGGRTVYLSFFKGFMSGLTETRRLSVNESGKFTWLNGGRP